MIRFVAACILFCAPLLAPAATLELQIPQQHPYLAMTPADIARAKERAKQFPWAKQIVEKTLRDADSHIIRSWDKLPPKGDEEHRRLSGRLLTAALAYTLSGDARYGRWVRDGLLAYAGIYPGLPLTRYRNKLFTQSSLYESTWLVPVAQAYDLVADSGLFTADQKKHVETDLLRAAAACFKIDDFQNDPRISDLHFRCYNFQAWHLAAIGLAGLAIKDSSLADYAVNSPYGFRHLVAHDIRDDGMFWERSESYHQFVLSALLPLAEAMARCGVDLYGLSVPNDRSKDEDRHYVTDTTDSPKSLRLMFEAPFYLTFPDLTFPTLGDSNPGPLRGTWQQLTGFHRYRAPKLAWLLERSGARSDWRWLIYDLPPEAASANPDLPLKDGAFANSGVYRNGCSLFPSTGLAILRQAAGDFTKNPDSTAASLSYGPHGGGHGHSDKLNLVVYANGRRWMPDFGSMPYETHWKAEWTAHTVSHNTIVVDGVSQRPTGNRNTQWPGDTVADRVLGKLERFDPQQKLAIASCDRAYDGILLKRRVRLWGHAVVDDFTADPAASASADRQFDYVLHIDGELAGSSVPLVDRSGKLGENCGYQYVTQKQAVAANDLLTLTFAAGPKQLRVWIAPGDGMPLDVIVAEGLTNSPSGKMPMLVLRRKATRARFVTVFEPVDPNHPIRGVRAEPDDVVVEGMPR